VGIAEEGKAELVAGKGAAADVGVEVDVGAEARVGKGEEVEGISGKGRSSKSGPSHSSAGAEAMEDPTAGAGASVAGLGVAARGGVAAAVGEERGRGIQVRFGAAVAAVLTWEEARRALLVAAANILRSEVGRGGRPRERRREDNALFDLENIKFHTLRSQDLKDGISELPLLNVQRSARLPLL
jgi:hypothetical protein